MNGCFLEMALRTAARSRSSVDMFRGGSSHFGGFVPFITFARQMFHFFSESFVGKWGRTDDTDHSSS